MSSPSPTPTVTEQPMCNAALVRAFGFLGKRWNGVILAVLGAGPAGFAELKRSVAGISDSMLSERLTELTHTGLVKRDVEPGPPVAVRYALSEAGTALVPALDAIATWSAENLSASGCAGKDGPVAD
ncbi:MAG: helix-turn-helix domain-containing protein [Nocardioides sp.]|uniref:winged helix-turn-helix transcriptional regulator n=1 Tax=Nocardioides sp. TaxID=35761 RepID=UPI0039E695BB